MSPATVDRVLHNRGGVKPKTVDRVLQKAEELNYTPNKSASFLARKKLVKVAFVLPEYPEYFWKEIEKGIVNALEDITDYGFHVDIKKTSNTIADQLETVHSIIDSEAYDGMVICPKDGIPLTTIIESAVNNNFPIFTFNNDSPESGRLSYVGADYFEAGKLAGDLASKFTGERKRFAIITDEADTYQMKQKRQGFEAFTIEDGDVDFVKLLRLNNQSMEDSLERVRQNVEDVDAIYVACGALAEVADQVKQLEGKKPVLIGHDLNDDVYHHLQDNIVTATICQDPHYQGNLAVRLAFNYLMLDKPPEKEDNIVKLEIVTRGNAKYYWS